MKKEIILINEKHERLTVSYKRRRIMFQGVCKNCGETTDFLTLEEVAALTGESIEDTRNNLRTLRKEKNKKSVLRKIN